MASEDFDLDDFDFEDFDLDIPDFDVEPAEDDRKPVEKLRSGFFEGVKDHVVNPATVEQSLRLALPEGYSAAFNAKDNVVSSVKELYHTAADELKPITSAVKNSIKKISPKTKEKLPKFIQNRIDEIQNEVEYDQQSAAAAKKEGEDNQIASVMQEIFRAQMESDQERVNEERSEELVQKTIETNQRNSLIESANIVAKGMDRVVGYQDNILSKYHQKSLELQFRHYFVAKDLLDLTSVHQGKLEEALATITKNTALPEAVKIEKSELAGQLIKERLLNSTIDGVAGFASRYRDKIMGNAKNFIGGVAGSIGMGASMAGSIPEGMDKSTMAGNMLGGLAAQYATEWASRELGEKIKDNDKIKRGNAKLLNIFSPGGMARKISQWGRSETGGSGWLSLGVDMLKSLVPQFYANDKVRDNPLLTSDKPAVYDQLARRSITEIIPTYLSQIAHWTKATATGVIDGDMQVYSLHRGGMTTKSSMLDDVKRAIMPRRENITAKNEIDAYIGKMFEGKEISDEAKAALRRQIMVDVNSNQVFDPRRYSKYEGYKDSKGSEDAIDELTRLFRDKFSVDEDGNYVSDETDLLMERSNSEQGFNRLASVMPTPDGRIRALVDAVGMDSLRELGMIKRVNREDKIDYDKVIDLILSDKEDESSESYQSLFDQKVTDKPFVEALKEKARKLAMSDTAQTTDSGDSEEIIESTSSNQLAAISKIKGVKETSSKRSVSDIKITGIQARVDALAMDPYLGDESPVIRELKNIQSLLKAQVVPQVTIDGSAFKEGHEYQKEHSAYLEAILEELRRIEFSDKTPADPNVPGWKERLKDKIAGKDTLLGGLNSIRNSRLGRGVGWTKDKVKGAVGGYLKGTKNFYKTLGTGTFSLGKFSVTNGFRGLSWGAKKLFETTETGDIFVMGRKVPALRKSLLEAGEYIDVNTKKVIRSAKDITGEVRDKAGNLILGEEDFKQGLADGFGKPLILKIAKRAFDFGSALLKPYKWIWDGLVGAKNYVMSKVELLSDGYVHGEKLPRIRATLLKQGFYFDQATGKVIRSLKDIKGTVVDKDGNVVITAEEIEKSGGLFNAVGDRIRTGVKSFGSGVGNLIGGVLSGAGSLTKSVFSAYGAVGKGIGNAIAGVSSFLTAPLRGFGFGFIGPQADKLLTLSYAQTAYQAEILKVLLQGKRSSKVKGSSGIDESWRKMDLSDSASEGGSGFSNPLKGMKNPFSKISIKNPLKGFKFDGGKLSGLLKDKKKTLLDEKDRQMAQVMAMITENQLSIKDKLEGAKKKILGDSDGDGTRDGAWWTRKRKGNQTTQTKAKEDKEKKSGIFGLLASALPMVVSGLTFIGSKIAGLAKALGMTKLLGGLLGGGPDIGGSVGKKGLLRRGAGLLARGAWGATKLVGGLVGRAAGFALFKAVPAVLGAAGTVLSSPVVLGGLAVGAAAYGAYKLYKHFTSKPAPIHSLRLTQYGFDPSNKSTLKTLSTLEEMHWKQVAYFGGKVSINQRGLDLREVLKLFDIDPDDQDEDTRQRAATCAHWYQTRFIPVFKLHAGAVKSLGEGFDMFSFEKEIKPKKALELIELVKMNDEAKVFDETVSPFEDEEITQDSNSVKKAVDEAIAFYKEKLGKDGDEKKTTELATATTQAAIKQADQVENKTPGASGSASVQGSSNIGQRVKGGLKVAAMVLGAPVLAPMAIVGKAMGLMGVDVKKLTVGQVVRLKAYGLIKLDSEKVNLLLEMENKAIKDIKFDGQKQGIWAGVDNTYLERYGSRFGVSTAEDKDRWLRWFTGRFLPVLVQFATSVKTRANVPILEAETRIRGATLRALLSEVVNATASVDNTSTPIWHVTDSPWSDYELNADRQSAEKTIESIEKVNDVHGDILGVDKKVKPKEVEDVDSTEEDKKGFFSRAADSLKTTASNALSSAKETASSLWNGMVDKVAEAKDAVVGTVAKAASVIPGGSSIMGPVANPSENRQALIDAMLEAGITDPKEQASFMAQLDHESGGFKVLRENLNYRASRLKEVFSRYRNNPAAAERDAGNPEAIANMVYGNRSDLGNTEPGDGWKYRGRGFIQLTGRDNFTRASRDLGIDLVNNPDLAETPEVAAKLAIWYWKNSNAGAAARAGDLRASRKAVNGGYNGMADVQGKFNTYLSQALAGKFQPSGEKPTDPASTTVAATAADSSGTTTTATAADSSGTTTTATAAGTVATGEVGNVAATSGTPSTVPSIAATGLTTVSAPTSPSQVVPLSTAPVTTTEAPVAATSVAPTPPPSPELKARVADTQSSVVEKMTDQQLSAISSIMERQLSIQTSIDGRLAQVVDLLKTNASKTPMPSTNPSSGNRTVNTPATPMPKSPVSVSRTA